MRTTPSFLMLAALLGVALAGCAGSSLDDDVPDDGLDTPSHGPDTGAIRGVVVDGDLLPIRGAAVALEKAMDAPVTTRADGVFVFSDLAPGRHVLVIQALGFEATKQPIDVRANQIAQVSVELRSLELEGMPYHVTLGPFPGRFFCGFAVPVVAGPCKIVGFADPNHPAEETYQLLAQGENNLFEFRTAIINNKTLASDQLRTLVVEVDWRAVSAGARLMQATIEDLPASPGARNLSEPRYAHTSGLSPLHLAIEPGVQSFEGARGTAMPLDHPGFSVGVFPAVDEDTPASAYNSQNFEIWFTLFYNEPARDGFTVFADR